MKGQLGQNPQADGADIPEMLNLSLLDYRELDI